MEADYGLVGSFQGGHDVYSRRTTDRCIEMH